MNFLNWILFVMFHKWEGGFYWGSWVALDPIKHNPRVYWTASKTFHKKCVSWESEQGFKLWGEDISIQEKQAIGMPHQYSLYKEY